MGFNSLSYPRARASKIVAVIFWISAFVGMTALAAFATPPSEVAITYDDAKGILHVSAGHPSQRPSRHYLRRLVIYKNGASVNELNFGFQKLAGGMEEDVPLKAGPGDRIKVELFCSQGGSGEAELTIAKPEQGEGSGEEGPRVIPANY